MKKCFTRLIALALTLGLTLSMAIGVSAAVSDFRVNVTANKTVQFIRDNKVAASYKALKANLTVKTGSNGKVIVSFPVAGGAKNISIGNQTSLVFEGTMNQLTIDKSLSADVSVEMQGIADTLTVNAPVELAVVPDADVAVLKVASASADVRVDKGAIVKECYAVDKKTVSGVSKVLGMSSAPSTNQTTTTEDITNKQGKIETYLDISYRDNDVEFCKNISIDGAYEISLEAKPGISLTTALRDLKLRVERADDSSKAVSGTWKWLTGGYDTKTSGVFYYQFTPTVATQYAPFTLKVNFTSNGGSTLEKVGLGFSDGQRSHGASGDSVSIDVAVPGQVIDDDKLEIYVNNKEVSDSPYYLSESDAGETSSFTVSPTGESGDKIKIKVRVKRGVGGSTTTSQTITYYID